uniref:Uncharacterized protein n=1 Tax=Rhizophora mucronata TaxID=61149 RepID=A0A2P2PX18_RHIMU
MLNTTIVVTEEPPLCNSPLSPPPPLPLSSCPLFI